MEAISPSSVYRRQPYVLNQFKLSMVFLDDEGLLEAIGLSLHHSVSTRGQRGVGRRKRGEGASLPP